MDNFLDTLWASIEHFLGVSVIVMDRILSPLAAAGPEISIFAIAFSTVILVTLLKRLYTTKRYRALKDNFEYWQSLREEAMAHEDREKGRAIAKNIDQAELNKAYYDYFFEGLMKSAVTTWLPLLLMLAYVNTSFSADRMRLAFGDGTLIATAFKGSSPLWYVICVILSFILVAVMKSMYKKKIHARQDCCSAETSGSAL